MKNWRKRFSEGEGGGGRGGRGAYKISSRREREKIHSLRGTWPEQINSDAYSTSNKKVNKTVPMSVGLSCDYTPSAPLQWKVPRYCQPCPIWANSSIDAMNREFLGNPMSILRVGIVRNDGKKSYDLLILCS